MAAASHVDLETYILQGYTFAKLPMPVKQALGNSKREWEKAVVEYSLSHQLRWKKNIVRKILEDEKKYYAELLHYSREHLMLYPYHLSDVMVKGLRTTSFTYYYNILTDMLKGDKSYDSLPNFPAADGVRLLGIGRNQYIDLMNQSRVKGLGLFRKRVHPKQLLPAKPVSPTNMAWWWEVFVGYVSEEDVKMSTPEEHALIDKLIDAGAEPLIAGHFDRAILESLHVKNLIYFTVPMADGDCIIVPPLEGFVMNRVLGDFFENLLYKIFVSIDEHTTIKDLAAVLRIDLQLVKDAVSMYCRLGFARKKGFDSPPLDGPFHASWRVAAASALPTGPSLLELDRPEKSSVLNALVTDLNTGGSGGGTRVGKRLALLFDASLTAVLMMGNLSPSLKTHAVTMFEAGKLSDEMLDSFLAELGKVDFLTEGDTQHYFNHAFTLLQTLYFLRHNRGLNCVGDEAGSGLSLDMVRCESLNSLDPATCERVLRKNYAALISMAPLARTVRSVVSCVPLHFGPAVPEISTVWFRLWLYQQIHGGPPSILYVAGRRVRRVPDILRSFETVLMVSWTQDPQEINTVALLPALNEALTNSPVLVQGHRIRAEVEVLHVPFPLQAHLDAWTAAHGALEGAGGENAGVSSIGGGGDEHGKEGGEGKTGAGVGGAAEAGEGNTSTTTATTATPTLSGSSLAAELNLPPALHGAVAADSPEQRAWAAACAAVEKLPVVEDTCKALALDKCFGYISLIRQYTPTAAAAVGGDAEAGKSSNGAASATTTTAATATRKPTTPIDPNSAVPECLLAQATSQGWVVSDVVFGLPIFDAALNRAVCHRIRAMQLLSEGNAKAMSHAQRIISLELLDFIAQYQCLPLQLDPETAPQKQATPYPTSSLLSVNGVITKIDPPELSFP